MSRSSLRLHHFNEAQLAEFCSNGLWLSRWPHCTKIGLDVGPDTEAQLYIPFATMPLEARQRITVLEVSCAGDESLAAISNAEQFRNLLQGLPSLTALQLLALPPPGPEAFWSASVRQLPPILDSLKQLKSLTVGSLEWVESYLLGDAQAGKLTRLEVVNGEEPLYDMLDPPESDSARHPSLPSCVRSMQCLRELELDVGVRDSFAPDDVGPMVAALPPSVKTFRMEPVGTRQQDYFSVSCALDGSGGLTSFELSIMGGLEAEPTPAAAATPSTATTASSAAAASASSTTASLTSSASSAAATAAPPPELLGPAGPVLWPSVQAVARLPAALEPHPHSRVLWDDDNTPIFVLMSLAARRAVEAAAALGSAQHS
ncbi:hypothetical protein HYH03_007647 [Edaphochlamys debaryana]|uniref:Uncharacterized protein n=1 Tax=Edaphochlamys debaryana TaxID=47281 RepID=A0A835Y309_9CHLO|nr:hypothetical protein HYH03_007647 [Edaphochlamys debaryana]|eukprot:KAG2494294.1 hypothetical protein HYH03_007647 [Edaphochlamys debaryana]